ncbi:hypothetical protein [Chengkuizengella axinellae]|uniref:DUF4489 domain-containing protein n=1 Tax=Chengkuizengella axinellae TaxID=3064388 RepID=A0ABT9IV66_9BACL|nr:hypothetical protein [Chengkuizengella sp. 2205SS18-9]MDP5273248.1 hypothetical protein [Chengkuizengella sp. 2205SS18-9]
MGVFNKSKCDCSVCPMQCVLKQLIGETLSSLGTFTNILINVTIDDVTDFIVITSEGRIPICQITFMRLEPTKQLKLKPIRKSKGECACCEDSTTNLLNTFKGKNIAVTTLPPVGFTLTGPVFDVGKGIVNLNNLFYISTPSIIRISPL